MRAIALSKSWGLITVTEFVSLNTTCFSVTQSGLMDNSLLFGNKVLNETLTSIKKRLDSLIVKQSLEVF